MTRAGYATIACLAALLGGGCASLGNDGQADPAICHPDSDSCDVEDFASADEAALRANREAVAVGCMDPGNAGTVQAQQARRAEQVAAALVRLNRRFAGTLAPGVVLGLLPILLSLVFPNVNLMLFGAMSLAVAVGDFAIVLLLAPQREVLVVDHPTDPGLAAFSKE